MTQTWRVIRRSDGEEVYRYTIDSGPLTSLPYPEAEYEHVLEEPPPKGPPQPVYGSRRVLSKLEFLRLFSPAERIAIRSYANTNPVLGDFLYLLDMATEVNLDSPDVIAGVELLESEGLLSEGRAAEVLNG